MKKKLLILGFVWPEPTSSAAGIRMMQLIHFFKKENYEIHFASTAKKSDFSYPLTTLNVKEHFIQLNHSSFDLFIQQLQPDAVMYDRFMVEEQFGWRIKKFCPLAFTILDTEDIHSLRKVRKKEKKKDIDIVNWAESDITQREIAAIFRCDLSLLISPVEMQLLQEKFNIPDFILHYLPFMEEKIDLSSKFIDFSDRQDFVFIGNFLHAPNWHSVLTLKEEVWPAIKEKLPQANLHIYGAYSSEKVTQLHHEKRGFIIKGRATNAVKTIRQYRVLLAPLTFGAGIKGKFLDAIKAGTPFVTTPIGTEGWFDEKEVELAELPQKAVELYENQEKWIHQQWENIHQFNAFFDTSKIEIEFKEKIEKLQSELSLHRSKNIVGKILWRNHFLAQKYMSLWIEEKNKE